MVLTDEELDEMIDAMGGKPSGASTNPTQENEYPGKDPKTGKDPENTGKDPENVGKDPENEYPGKDPATMGGQPGGARTNPDATNENTGDDPANTGGQPGGARTNPDATADERWALRGGGPEPPDDSGTVVYTHGPVIATSDKYGYSCATLDGQCTEHLFPASFFPLGMTPTERTTVVVGEYSAGTQPLGRGTAVAIGPAGELLMWGDALAIDGTDLAHPIVSSMKMEDKGAIIRDGAIEFGGAVMTLDLGDGMSVRPLTTDEVMQYGTELDNHALRARVADLEHENAALRAAAALKADCNDEHNGGDAPAATEPLRESAMFIADATVDDDKLLWVIENTGTTVWPPGKQILNDCGDLLTVPAGHAEVHPGDTVTMEVVLGDAGGTGDESADGEARIGFAMMVICASDEITDAGGRTASMSKLVPDPRGRPNALRPERETQTAAWGDTVTAVVGMDTQSDVHIFNDMAFFPYGILRTPGKTVAGIGGTAEAIGIGTAYGIDLDGQLLVMPNAIYVPDSPRCVLSVPQLDRQRGVRVTFSPKFTIEDIWEEQKVTMDRKYGGVTLTTMPPEIRDNFRHKARWLDLQNTVNWRDRYIEYEHEPDDFKRTPEFSAMMRARAEERSRGDVQWFASLDLDVAKHAADMRRRKRRSLAPDETMPGADSTMHLSAAQRAHDSLDAQYARADQAHRVGPNGVYGERHVRGFAKYTRNYRWPTPDRSFDNGGVAHGIPVLEGPVEVPLY